MIHKYKRLLSQILIAIFIFTNIFISNAQIYAASDSNEDKKIDKHKAEILVKYKDKVNQSDIKGKFKNQLKLKNLNVKKTFSKSNIELLELDINSDINAVIEELSKNPDIEYAQPNYELTLLDGDINISTNSKILALYEVGQVIEGQEYIPGLAINLLPAWDITKGSPDVIIGVLDTGIDINHKDLTGNIFTNINEIAGNGIDDDSNGYIDDTIGWDFANNDNTVNDTALETHGTHIAGIIAAKNDGEGISGIAPNVRILPLKFADGQTGYTSDAIEAIQYAEAMGVKIINNSWGSNINNIALYDTISSSNMLFVCAAGNDNSSTASYPAAFDLPNVISVGAVNEEGLKASFSNYGESVHVAAPGVSIISTIPQDSYGITSGTSMAAPYVTGAAALLASSEPELNTAQIAERIKANAAPNENLKYLTTTGGIVDAYSTLINVNKSSNEVSNAKAYETDDKFIDIYNIVAGLTSITLAEQQQKQDILDYYGVVEENIVTAEQAGYSIWDSIGIAKLGVKYYLTVNEAITLMQKYGSILNLEMELTKLERIKARYLVPESKIDQIKQILINGHNAEEIRSAYIASEVTALPIDNLLKNETEGDLNTVLTDLNMQCTETEIQTLNTLFEQYNINKTALLSYMQQNSITVEQINNLFIQYEANILTQYNEISGEAVDLYSNGGNGQIDYEKYFSAPYSYRAGNNEDISLNTGTLTYSSVDLSLKGKNGLDLNIVTKYDSSDAKLYEEGYSVSHQYTYRVNVTPIIYFLGVNGSYQILGAYQTMVLDGFSSYYSAYTQAVSLAEDKEHLEEINITKAETREFTKIISGSINIAGWTNPWSERRTEKNTAAPSYYVNEDGYTGSIPFASTTVYSDTGYKYSPSSIYANREFFTRTILLRHTYRGSLDKFVTEKTGDIYIGYAANVESCYAGSNYYNTTTANTYNEMHNNMGAGWSLGFSSIELNGGNKYLHMANGGTYKINITAEAGDSNLEKYTLRDMRLEADSGSYTNGAKSSSYVLIYKNGQKEYFADDGRLIGIQDRNGNTIKFEHTTINGHPLISKITDTANRIVTISYESTPTGKKVVISTPDNTTIQYILEPIAGYSGEYKLVKKIDQMNRETSFNYDINTAYFSLFSKTYRGGTNPYANLTEVKYPTKASSRYTYEKTVGNMGNQGTSEYFRITKREDVDKDKIYNKQTYNYIGSYTGYPNNNDPANLSSSYSYITEITDSSMTKTSIKFNNKHLKTIEDRKENGTILTARRELEYDANKLPVKIITKLYNKSTGQSMDTVQNFAYDTNNYGDMTAYWDSQSQRDANNIPIDSEHKTAYTYNPQYHYVTSKEYKQDAAATIKEELIPYADSKNIEWIRIYENNTLKKQSRFIYDSYGNIIEEQNYLEDWTNYISHKADYTDNDITRNGQLNGSYPTKSFTEGIIDADGNLIQAKNGNTDGTIERIMKYDWYGNTVEKQDGMGYTSTYQYDKLGRVLKEIYPDTSFKEVSYNDTQNSLTVTNENGYQFKLVYDGFGNLLSIQDLTSGQILKQYEYDEKLRVIKESNHNDNRITEYYYNSDDRIGRTEIKNDAKAVLYSEILIYENVIENGSLNKTTKIIEGDADSPSIITTAYTDKYGQLVKQGAIHNGIEYTDTFKYNYLGGKTEEKTARAYQENWTEAYTAKYQYNYEGKVTKQYNVDGEYTAYEYDSLGRLKSLTDIKGSKADIPYSTTYKYDGINRLIEEKVPFENVNGTITYSIKKNYYDRNSNKISEKVTDNKALEAENYKKIEYSYNNRNMLTKVTTFDEGQAENYTQYYYDKVGNKLRMYTGLSSPLEILGLDNIIPSADNEYSVTKYEYDQHSQLTKMTDPLGMSETYSYDAYGSLTNKVDRNGNGISMTYDAMNRSLGSSVSCSDSSANVLTQYTYTQTGMRKFISSGNESTSYVYDDLGRLIKETEENGITKEYTYDAGNNRKSMLVKKDGTAVINTTYEYDKMNRLQYVYENGQQIASYSYDDNGNRNTLTYSNGVNTQYQYNLANKVTSLVNNNSTGEISNFSHTYYLDGNQASKTDNNGTTAYQYDDLGRLLSEIQPDSTSISYQYDDYNNRSAMTMAGITETISTNYQYDKNNRLQWEEKTAGEITEITNYYYDNNGNQISKLEETIKPISPEEVPSYSIDIAGEQADSGIELYEYDGFNRLTKAIINDKTISYTYNGDGLRSSKTVNGITTAHIWDGDQIALELDGAGNIGSKYIRGINLIYADTAGAQSFYIYNAHGDVEQLADIAGNVTKEYDYDAFGVEKNIDTMDNNPFRYCGEYFDKETGSIYLRARYYDASIGRFISEDSYLGNNSDPLSLNLYTYCNGNPVMFIDPSGHDAIIITAGKGALGFGHTSMLVQDSDGKWFYTFWGDTNVVVAEVTDEDALKSLEGLNEWLQVDDNEPYYYGTDYTSSTYIAGDFTGSLEYFKELERKYLQSTDKRHHEANPDYRVLYRNCIQQTMKSLEYGVLNDGVSVKNYTDTTLIPNVAAKWFKNTFYNNAYTKDEYLNQLQAVRDKIGNNRISNRSQWHEYYNNKIKLEMIEHLLSN